LQLTEGSGAKINIRVGRYIIIPVNDTSVSDGF